MDVSSETTFPLLKRVIERGVDDLVINYLVDYVCKLFKLSPDASNKGGQSTCSSSTPKSSKPRKAKSPLPRLHDFIHNISARSKCTMSTMLVTLIYLQRLAGGMGSSNPIGTKPCSRHRVVFAAIMISHKIWNDCSMVGKHWAEVSNMFKSDEVLTMEREILLLLQYDLELTTEEIWQTARPFMAAPYMKVSKGDILSVDLCSHLLDLQKTQSPSRSEHSTSPTQCPSTAISTLPPVTYSPSVVTPDTIHPFSSLRPLTARSIQTHSVTSSVLVPDHVRVSSVKSAPQCIGSALVDYQSFPPLPKSVRDEGESLRVRNSAKPKRPSMSTRPSTHRLSPSPDRFRKRKCIESNKFVKVSHTRQPSCVNRGDLSSTTPYTTTTSYSSSNATTPSYTSPLAVLCSPLVWYAQPPLWYANQDPAANYINPITLDGKILEHSSLSPFVVEND